MKIGVIDDSLAGNVVFNFANIQRYEIHNGKVMSVENDNENCEMTHSTSCCIVLHDYIIHPEMYSLLHINIMQEHQLKMDDFIVAMKFFLDKQINILCLSIGTTILSDAVRMYPIIKKLSEQNVLIIAASSNANLITFPAAYVEVLGTITLPSEYFATQKLYGIPKNDLEINVGVGMDRSNSYSSPLVVAQLLNMGNNESVVNSREELYNILSNAIECISQKQFDVIERELLPQDNEQVPIVIIDSEDGGYTFADKIMENLAGMYNYESACIIDSVNKNTNFRFVEFNAEKFYKQYQNRFNRDIDILFVLSNILGNINMSQDLYIKANKIRTMLFTSKACIKYCCDMDVRSICGDIVELLKEA